jgi:hypothetical protein
MAPDPGDIDDLRKRLRATAEAAERIAGKVPPQGWATPREREETAGEIHALVALLHALRDVVPEELWDQVREITRQLLLLLRAVLDLMLERLGPDGAGGRRAAGPAGEAEIQDIPIA